MADGPSELTELLRRGAGGDVDAREQAFSVAYDELRGLARVALRSEAPGHTLEATALVNEAAIRLLDQRTGWNDRRHFFAIAARAMRRVLVDHARARDAVKRGAGRRPIALSDDVAGQTGIDLAAVMTLDDLLTKLEALDGRKARVVELRYFAGLDEVSTAEVLGVSRSTVSQDWSFARAWLAVRLSEAGTGDD